MYLRKKRLVGIDSAIRIYCVSKLSKKSKDVVSKGGNGERALLQTIETCTKQGEANRLPQFESWAIGQYHTICAALDLQSLM